jgi:hypothetical protein
MRVTLRRKCPIETGAHIVEMPGIDGQPLGLRPRLAFRLSIGEYSTIMFGMAPGDLLELARTLQLLECVEARRVEEAIPSNLAARISGDQ